MGNFVLISLRPYGILSDQSKPSTCSITKARDIQKKVFDFSDFMRCQRSFSSNQFPAQTMTPMETAGLLSDRPATMPAKPAKYSNRV